MKLPNNYGSVTKLTGARRKPYMVRICTGKKYMPEKEGYELERKVLGYYATKKEALAALAEYNNNPFEVSDSSITFGMIYKRWSERNYASLSSSSISSREAAFKNCGRITDMKIRDIRTDTLQEVIDSCPLGTSTKKNILTCMHTVFDYAMQNNLVSRDYSQYVKIEASEPILDRIPYSDKEIKLLWKKSSEWDVQILLILLYSGLRINELLKNTKDNVNLEERWIYVPKELAKNKSSIRYVPIHDKVYPIVKEFYERSNGPLITNPSGTVIKYNNFASRNMKRLNEYTGTEHRLHDTRHTFISNAHLCKMDDLCLKLIVGHTPDGITKKVYTHIPFTNLLTEVNKMQ